jgi:hypothetical protein
MVELTIVMQFHVVVNVSAICCSFATCWPLHNMQQSGWKVVAVLLNADQAPEYWAEPVETVNTRFR